MTTHIVVQKNAPKLMHRHFATDDGSSNIVQFFLDHPVQMETVKSNMAEVMYMTTCEPQCHTIKMCASTIVACAHLHTAGSGLEL